MDVPVGDLAAARDEFRYLLGCPTKESDWQKFFSLHPYVLSMAMPLRIEPTDIVPLGRTGQTEPDFIFYPRNKSPVPYYGVIELKKPSSKIVTITRANVAVLTTDANTAIQQAATYSDEITRFAPALADQVPLLLGNRAHLFVVMGMSREISQKLATDLYRDIIAKQFPRNLQLLPFDTLLDLFESELPQRLYVLVPESIPFIEDIHHASHRPKLYVGGLPYSTTEGELREAFSRAGTVVSVAINMDKMTNRSKGFGFVEMGSSEDAQKAIALWNASQFGNRTLTVNEARPLERRAPRRGGFERENNSDRGGRTW